MPTLRTSALILCAIVSLSCVDKTPARSEEPSLSETVQNQIETLESQVFQSKLTLKEVDALLKRLPDPEQRDEAVDRLVYEARGYQDRIVEASLKFEDKDVKLLCVDLIYMLDGVCKRTTLGGELADLYEQHTAAIFPEYWKEFLADPLGRRASNAVAYSDFDTAWEWLKENGDELDRARYLLVRARERGFDQQGAAHYRDQPATAMLWVLNELYPIPLPHENLNRKPVLQAAAGYRIVGNSVTDAIELETEEVSTGGARLLGGKIDFVPISSELPKLGSLITCGRRVYIYEIPTQQNTQVFSHTYLQYDAMVYDPARQKKEAFFKLPLMSFHTGPVPGLPKLPLLDLAGDQIAWHFRNDTSVAIWAKPYIPTYYQERMRYRPKWEGEIDPPLIVEEAVEDFVAPVQAEAPLKKADPNGVSLVLLPARIKAQLTDELAGVAELLNDRLAQEIDHAGLAVVVDRGQLNTMLKEREFKGVKQQAIISFDCMLQLEVDASQPVTRATLKMIRANTGNLLAEREIAWPPQESEVPELIQFCREGLSKAKAETKGRIKTRLLGMQKAAVANRLAPLAEQMLKTFHEGLASSDQVLLMQHLEAGSTREESLLEMLGLARLPGGERFGPEADLTIDLQIEEFDSVGKTFQETPIRISFRIRKQDETDSDPTVTVGTVKDFSQTLETAWEKLAAQIKSVDPEAIQVVLDQNKVRQTQALAELAAGRAEVELDKKLARFEAALKLDPLLDEAMEELLGTQFAIFQNARFTRATEELAHKIFRETVNQLRRLEAQAANEGSPEINVQRQKLVDIALRTLANAKSGWFQGNKEHIQRLRYLVEQKVEIDPNIYIGGWSHTIGAVYSGMSATGTPAEECQRWLDEMISKTGDPNYDIRAVVFSEAVNQHDTKRCCLS